ncbi:MAG: hypothetical protein L0Z53_15010 [Acidobacteriales bacterium]|nr:hypothetical protein [Terriglobales bacterium]
MTTKKDQLTEMYIDVGKRATRYILSEGLSEAAAFAKAVPEHFEAVAEERHLVPTAFQRAVYEAIRAIENEPAKQKKLSEWKGIQSGQISIRMGLGGDKDHTWSIWYALKVLHNDFGVVRRPSPRTWATVQGKELPSEQQKKEA